MDSKTLGEKERAQGYSGLEAAVSPWSAEFLSDAPFYVAEPLRALRWLRSIPLVVLSTLLLLGSFALKLNGQNRHRSCLRGGALPGRSFLLTDGVALHLQLAEDAELSPAALQTA